jgi:hypothetical protein
MNQTQIQQHEEFFSKLMKKCEAESWNSIPTDKLIGTVMYSMKYKAKKTAEETIQYYCGIGLLQAGMTGYLITAEAKKKYWGAIK